MRTTAVKLRSRRSVALGSTRRRARPAYAYGRVKLSIIVDRFATAPVFTAGTPEEDFTKEQGE